MDYFELFQESPGLFFLAVAISLFLTLFIYGAFPIIFAKIRKTPITKKKYKRLCYGINFIGVIFFVALNGASSGAPYLLWTWVFSNYGTKSLDTKNLLIDLQDPTKKALNSPPKILFCRKCGAALDTASKFCRKCGTEIKEVND